MGPTTPVQDDHTIVYPESDGQPMADNTVQYRWLVMIKEGIERVFRDDPNVFVAGDLLWYPVRGKPAIRKAPDVLVAFGRPKGDRGSYLQWKEQDVPPQVVFEVLSPGNREEAMREKRDFYERYGVEEYYIYDPDERTIEGFRRDDDRLVPIGPMRRWVSPRLGVRFDWRRGELCLIGPDGRRFETVQEVQERADRVEREAKAAKRARRAAERRAEMERLTAENERLNAENQRLRAEAARLSAEAERARAERLAERLRSLGIDPESS
jgi:Uma2 family endonuclease